MPEARPLMAIAHCRSGIAIMFMPKSLRQFDRRSLERQRQPCAFVE